ncbi:hypothetical protein T492DRAFT_1070431 [Pavlovales sp. CCMP2436]|nr:hypothetical protein T492DRAFT_1070431 [Pavlovales sp. CCMP2436]
MWGAGFFVRPRLDGSPAHVLLASLHPWHELLVPEPLVLAGWMLVASRQRRPRPPPAAAVPAEGDEEGEDNICAICLSAVKPARDSSMGVTTLHCGHVFHPCCISQWLTQSTRCPLCRAVEGDTRSEQRDGSRHRPARPRSLFVTVRNLGSWMVLHNEVLSMTLGYALERSMSLMSAVGGGASSPYASIALSAGWVMLLHNLVPAPRADLNPVQVLLGVRNTPHFLRMWTSWIRFEPRVQPP